MGYFSDISESLLTAIKGMGVTLAHVREKPNTVQWPHAPATTQPRTRSELFNNIDDCIGCLNCAKACPVDCIDIATVKSTKAVDLGRTSNGKKKTMLLATFDIDMAKCCYCGLCVDVCPTECLIMTEKFDYSTARMTDLQYSFARMSPEEILAAQTALEDEKRQAAVAAAAAKAAAEKAAAEKAAAAESPGATAAPEAPAGDESANPATPAA